jgi:hypothetical protein
MAHEFFKKTVDEVEAELYKRGKIDDYDPTPPAPTPLHLSERARILLTYVTDNLVGKPRREVLKLFSSGMFGSYSQAQEAWAEILNSRIPIGTIFTPETPADESEGLMAMSKDQVETLIAHALTSGYAKPTIGYRSMSKLFHTSGRFVKSFYPPYARTAQSMS